LTSIRQAREAFPRLSSKRAFALTWLSTTYKTRALNDRR
jgi:hypothetical protein